MLDLLVSLMEFEGTSHRDGTIKAPRVEKAYQRNYALTISVTNDVEYYKAIFGSSVLKMDITNEQREDLFVMLDYFKHCSFQSILSYEI